MLVKPSIFDALKRSRPAGVSLSRYFPKGTHYFYAYPSGEESGFLNLVPPAVEELVAARPLVCAGSNVTVIAFANAVRPDITDFVHSNLSAPLVPKSQKRVLPHQINAFVVGKERNDEVKHSLKQNVKLGSLVMAQPFMDDDLVHLYQISPKLTNWLNDKQHMASYVPEKLLAKRYGLFENGQAFIKSKRTLQVPCVVKVSSSSAGDGVYICKDKRSLHAVKTVLKNMVGTIVVEQYIDAKANYGIQFGIPEDPNLPIDVIGINQQLTTDDGEFIGGIVDPKRSYKELEAVKETLVSEILPQVRELGWYGVGCFDVLVDASGKSYIIDCNFRMTGMTAYLMLVANNQIQSSLVSFSGEFYGTLEQFQSTIASVVSAGDIHKPVRVIALTEQDGICRFNAALLFENRRRVPTMARQLLQAGVVSKALEQLSSRS